MGVVCSGHFWPLASLATETTGGEILVAFWPNMASEAISECLILKTFPGGACPQTPLPLFTLKCTQWPYHSKIAGSSPVVTVVTVETVETVVTVVTVETVVTVVTVVTVETVHGA